MNQPIINGCCMSLHILHIANRSDYSSKHFNTVLVFTRRCRLLFLFLITFDQLFCQDTTSVVPDGTEGEIQKVDKSDSLVKPITFENWNYFDGSLSTLKIGLGFLYDFMSYSQDEEGKRQMDSANATLKSDFEVRDFRLTAGGTFKFKRSISWKVGFMFDGDADSWLVRETGVMIGVPELSGHVFIGRTKEGFSLNKVMVGYAGWGIERQIAIDVIPILADGVKLLGYLPEQGLLWNIGLYTNWLSKNQSFSTYKWQFAARIGWMPVYSEADNRLIHLAINIRYGEPEGGEFRMRSRPEASGAPFFIDTQKFPTQNSKHMGVEAYLSLGQWMFGTEYYFHQFSSPETDNPVFQGGEVVATYILTGESRPYNTVSGIYTFVPVSHSVFDGGPGAWEAVLRFSALDLNGGTLRGGEFWRITPMISWYLSGNFRLEFVYGYGILSRFNLEGVTQFFQSRIQVLF